MFQRAWSYGEKPIKQNVPAFPHTPMQAEFYGDIVWPGTEVFKLKSHTWARIPLLPLPSGVVLSKGLTISNLCVKQVRTPSEGGERCQSGACRQLAQRPAHVL